ncbi:MAG: hypothetical protein PHH16_04980 [Candidatus Gracilibacteria bacterium]|nr:hypothetical protein [Candidatus Gracilibacteria bacterium]
MDVIKPFEITKQFQKLSEQLDGIMGSIEGANVAGLEALGLTCSELLAQEERAYLHRWIILAAPVFEKDNDYLILSLTYRQVISVLRHIKAILLGQEELVTESPDGKSEKIKALVRQIRKYHKDIELLAMRIKDQQK